jgi:cobyrinic acid a,c-diamide synthase
VNSEPDEKLFDLDDSEGEPVASSGSRRGNITGSFFHLVDYL